MLPGSASLKIKNLDTGEDVDADDVLAQLPQYCFGTNPVALKTYRRRGSDVDLAVAPSATQTKVKIVLSHFRLLGLWYDLRGPEEAGARDVGPAYSVFFKSRAHGWSFNPLQTAPTKIDLHTGLVQWQSPVTIMSPLTNEDEGAAVVEVEFFLVEHPSPNSEIIIGSAVVNVSKFMKAAPAASARRGSNVPPVAYSQLEAGSPTSLVGDQKDSYARRAETFYAALVAPPPQITASVVFNITKQYSQSRLLVTPTALLHLFVSINKTATHTVVSVPC